MSFGGRLIGPDSEFRLMPRAVIDVVTASAGKVPVSELSLRFRLIQLTLPNELGTVPLIPQRLRTRRRKNGNRVVRSFGSEPGNELNAT